MKLRVAGRVGMADLSFDNATLAHVHVHCCRSRDTRDAIVFSSSNPFSKYTNACFAIHAAHILGSFNRLVDLT